MILETYRNAASATMRSERNINNEFSFAQNLGALCLKTFGMAVVLFGLFPLHINAQILPKEIAESAVENNKSLQEMQLLVEVAREKSTQASALADPQLAFGLFAAPVETRNGPQRFSVAVSQSLPWFGVRHLRSSVADSETEIRLSNYRLERNRLLFQLESLWIERTFLIETNRLLEELSTETSLALEVLKSQSEAGNRSLVDVLNMELTLEKLSIDVRSNQQKIRSLEANLRSLVQSDVTFPLGIFPPSNELPLSPESDEIHQLLASNEEIAKARLDIQKALTSVDLVQASQKPSFMVGATYINIGEAPGMVGADNGKDAFILPQIGVSLPIWAGKNRSQRKEAELLSQSSQLRMENLTERFQGQLLGAIFSFSEAKTRLSDVQNLLSTSEEIWQQSLVQLELGNRSYSDILPVYERHIALKRSLLESHRAALNAFAQITFLTSSYL